MSQPTTQNQTTKNIILSYLSYLALFVGTGFISGAIVHSGNISELPKYTVIGIVGVSLFLAGSFIQEFTINQNSAKTGITKFFFFSLLLSVGIGMISGGTQHFSDFPIYSSYLIPLGLIISLVAFVLKNGFILSIKTFGTVIGVFALIALPLYLGLNTYANSLVSSQKNDCKTSSWDIQAIASEGHNNDNKCKNQPTKTANLNPVMNMDSMSNGITDDRSFLENMIPHHEEAVTSSTKVIATTTDAELKTFRSEERRVGKECSS